MDLNLKEKVVVITGGSRGIGFACVEEFLKEGAKVVFCSRNKTGISEALTKLEKYSTIEGTVVDMTQNREVQRLAEHVYGKYGYIDVWVNNAGSIGDRENEFFSTDEIDFVYQQCFRSTVFGTQAAAKYMKENGGAIINVSSLAARCPSAGRSTIYGPMKAAIVNYTIAMAGELSAYGVRVNCIMPGFTMTELIKGKISKEELEKNQNGTLLRRLAEPEEIAKPIVFLASKAASYVTGATLEVSGGRSITLNPMYSYELKEKEI